MTSLLLPEHVAAAREKQLNAVQGVVSDAYVAAEDRVFDPSKLPEASLDRLPTPTGWRMLILPFQGKKRSDGGVFIPDQVREREQIATVCGYVLKMGPDCYKDTAKFPNGAWCKAGEWVIFGRYAGSRFKIEGGEVRLLNDDEILARISDPNDIVHI
jgi:co-chaperonin GroES (HSP10)